VQLFVNKSIKRNIGIMLDMVFNHTSTKHVWFQKALKGEKKYQDYYILKEGSKEKAPTNWQSKFGGSAWQYSEELGKWYLHLFDVSQADLNWENKELSEAKVNKIQAMQNSGYTIREIADSIGSSTGTVSKYLK